MRTSRPRQTRTSVSLILVVGFAVLSTVLSTVLPGVAPLLAQDPPPLPRPTDPDDPLFGDWEDDWSPPEDDVETDPIPSFWDFDLRRGLRFQGPDGVPRLRLGGRGHLTGYLYDERNTRDSEVRFENVELRLDGEALRETRLRVEFDLDGRDTRDGLDQATVSHEFRSYLRATAGLQRIPMGIESSISDDELPFFDYGFSTWIDERTDLSLRLDGELLGGFLNYDGGFSIGEGFDTGGERIGDPRLSLRLALYPFAEDALIPSLGGWWSPLQGMFVSGAYAYENSFHRALAAETEFRNRLFETTTIDADSAEWWHFGWGIDAGPFRLIHEWSKGSLYDVDLGASTIDLDDQLTTMQISLGVRIHGPDHDTHPSRLRPDLTRLDWSLPEEGVPPFPDFTFPGEVELAVRYSNGDMDRRLFELGLADYAVSSQEFRTWTGAVSIRPSRNLRVQLEVVRVIADQRPAAFERGNRDTSFGLRLEYSF